jgi:effector-binding domain-containing protein
MPEIPQIQQRAACDYAGIPLTVAMDGIGAAVDAGFPELFGWLGGQGIAPAGPPFIRYHVVDLDGELEIELGVPVTEPVTGSGRIRAGVLPGGQWVTLLHAGPYDGLVAANAAVQDWAREHDVALDSSPDGRHWAGRAEHYLTDPSAEPDPSRRQTEVAYLTAGPARPS